MVGTAYHHEHKPWEHPKNVDLESVVKKVHDRTEIVIPIKPTETYTDKFEKKVHTPEFERRRQEILKLYSKYEIMAGSSNLLVRITSKLKAYNLRNSADFHKYCFDWDVNKNRLINKP